MNFELPWDIQTLRDTVRDFVTEKLIPIETGIEEDQPLALAKLQGLQAEIKDLGLWLLDMPEAYGGPGLGFLARCVIEQEIAKTKALPFRGSTLFGPASDPILDRCDERQKRGFLEPLARGEAQFCFALSEPGGSDPAALATSAVRDGDIYRLNGAKSFVSGGASATHAEVICRTEDGLSCLIVDLKSPGVTVSAGDGTLTVEPLAEVVFADVRVSAENLVGNGGNGADLAEAWLTRSRLKSVAARAVGFAERALEMATAYSTERKTFGQTLSRRGAVQRMIAESAIEIEAARLLVYQAAWLLDEGKDARNASRMAKVFATEMANRVIDRAIQIFGGTGLMRDLPLEYWYRQARSLRIVDGASETLRAEIAKDLIGAAG